MKIRKDDNVLIISGKNRGKNGRVLKTFPRDNKIIVEGINIVKKHRKPTKGGEKGQILEITSPISVANAQLICKKCKKATRIGYSIGESGKTKKKIRICKKCGAEQ